MILTIIIQVSVKTLRRGKVIKKKIQYRASLVAQLVENPHAMRVTWVQSLGWEDPLERLKSTHSSILAWIPWTVLSPVQFSSVQSLSHVWLFATPWIAARQASLTITNSWSSLKPMSIGSVMLSSHLILCHPLLLLPPNSSQYQGLFQWVNSSHEVAKVLEFQLQHQSFQWTPKTDVL